MISCVSEDSVLVTFGDRITPTHTLQIATLCNRLELHHQDWLVDLIPSYTTLLVVYDPMRAGVHTVCQCINDALAFDAQHSSAKSPDQPSQRHHKIPVYYSEETGPDLLFLAQSKGLSIEEVIQRHSALEYQVYAIGFMPGFGFLGSVDPKLATPRKDTPRASVSSGSVGIANQQTAIYPKTSPGGWQIIGRSPTTMFDSQKLSLLNIGDRVQFLPISREHFMDLGGEL